MSSLSNDDRIADKLDAILHVLQDIFILEGANAGIKKEEIRKILSIDKLRIGRISKHLKSKQARKEGSK